MKTTTLFNVIQSIVLPLTATAFGLPTLQLQNRRSLLLKAFLVESEEESKATLAAAASITYPQGGGRTSEQRRSKSAIFFQRLSLRLDTHEDKFDVHKWSASMYTLSGFMVLGAGIQNGFSDIPESLFVPFWTWSVGSVSQAITSLQMTAAYRKNDETVKKGFDVMSYALLQAVWLAIYSSPFAPQVADNFWFSSSMSLLCVFPVLAGNIHELLHLHEKMSHRARRNKEKGGDLGGIGDILAYGLAVAIGTLPAVGAIPFLTNPEHDRQWFLHCQDFPSGELFVTYGFYATVLSSLVVGFQAFAITLRDKKLISKDQEQASLAFLNLLLCVAFAKQFGLV